MCHRSFLDGSSEANFLGDLAEDELQLNLALWPCAWMLMEPSRKGPSFQTSHRLIAVPIRIDQASFRTSTQYAGACPSTLMLECLEAMITAVHTPSGGALIKAIGGWSEGKAFNLLSVCSCVGALPSRRIPVVECAYANRAFLLRHIPVRDWDIRMPTRRSP